MARRAFAFAVVLLLTSPVFARPLPVVASFSILADMARQIGGDAVAVVSLVPANADAHDYQPTPSDLRAIRGAGLVVVNGLGLEGWIDRLIPAAGYSGPVVVATRAVVPRRMDQNGSPATDPHAWQDLRRGAAYARAIADGLAAADPANAADFRARADAYVAEIERTDAWVVAEIAAVPVERRRILTSHDAFGYFGERYGVEFVAVQGLDTEAEPSAKAIAALIRRIRQERIHAVFLENMTNAKLAQAVARETGVAVGPVVYSDALSKPDGPAPSYLRMFRYNVKQFVRAMRAG